MEDFNLVIKELITKGIEKVDVPQELVVEFEKTAERYIENGNFLDAIKVYALTKNKNKLIETSNLSLKEEKPYDAFQGFCYANDPANLDRMGFIMLQIPDVETALKCFQRSNNQEMIEFITKNF